MSITIRQWTQEELDSLTHNKWLATVFMNRKSFSAEEIEYYPYKLRKVYICEWVDEPEAYVVYATDEKMLLKFIDAEYTRRPDFLHQKITQYRPVKLD